MFQVIQPPTLQRSNSKEQIKTISNGLDSSRYLCSPTLPHSKGISIPPRNHGRPPYRKMGGKGNRETTAAVPFTELRSTPARLPPSSPSYPIKTITKTLKIISIMTTTSFRTNLLLEIQLIIWPYFLNLLDFPPTSFELDSACLAIFFDILCKNLPSQKGHEKG